MQILLGSQSPRRKEILSYFSFPFKQTSPSFDEEAVAFLGDPEKYVQTLALGKADSFSQNQEDTLLITADTVVYCSPHIYNKPKSADEAVQFLLTLAGRWHSVYTAVCFKKGKETIVRSEEARVLFHEMTPLEAFRYQAAIGSFDKAGGYAIQGAGSLAIKKIDGCITNVMGLPVTLLKEMFAHFGIDIWEHMRPCL